MRKTFALATILLMAISGLVIVNPAASQSMLKPSVPQFTLQYIDYITNIEPTTSTNPYNGQNVTTSYGSTSYNETVVFKIKNQPFTPYKDSNGNYIGLYYNFRYKGHYQNQWTYMPFNPDGMTATPWGGWLFGTHSLPYFPQTSSDNTTFVFALTDFVPYGQPAFPDGGQLDFQLQAQIGNISYASEGSPSLGNYYRFTGESSDWSNTQTLNITYNSNSTATNASLNSTLSPSPTPTPFVPEFSWMAILPLFVCVLGFAVLVRHRKTHNLTQ